MIPFSELKIGDVVEVCRIKFPGGTEWSTAVIVEVRGHAIGVRFMQPNPKGDYVALHRDERGRVWR